MYMCKHIYMCMYMSSCIWICIHVYAMYMSICICMCMYMCACVCILVSPAVVWLLRITPPWHVGYDCFLLSRFCMSRSPNDIVGTMTVLVPIDGVWRLATAGGRPVCCLPPIPIHMLAVHTCVCMNEGLGGILSINDWLLEIGNFVDRHAGKN